MWNGMKWIRFDLRLAIYARDGFACVYCGVRDNLQLDHLVPRILGGSNKPSNLVTACETCNKSKGDMPWREFASDEAIERIEKFRRRGIIVRRRKAKVHLASHDHSWKEALSSAIRHGLLA